jgi:LPS-assembly protein
LSLDKTGTFTAGSSLLGRNADQMTFLGNSADTFRGRALTGIGMEYRLPMAARSTGMTHIIEPIGQVVLRPDEVTDRALVNEDAQSLVFDDTNIFAISKFSGYDRFEGGLRANYGAQYTARYDSGGYANFLFGQSYQMAGRNSYANPDAANTGLGSGLDTKQSDYIARAAISVDKYSFVAKTRLDPTDMHMRRLDLLASGRFGDFSSSIQYARYEAQPFLGYDKRREGIVASSSYRFDQNYFMSGTVIFDMSRHLNTGSTNSQLFSVAGLGLGAGYSDECTTLTVNYTSTYPQNTTAATTRNQTIILQLVLRTLGQAKVSTSVSALTGTDGLSH